MLIVIDYYAENPIENKTIRYCKIENSTIENTYSDYTNSYQEIRGIEFNTLAVSAFPGEDISLNGYTIFANGDTVYNTVNNYRIDSKEYLFQGQGSGNNYWVITENTQYTTPSLYVNYADYQGQTYIQHNEVYIGVPYGGYSTVFPEALLKIKPVNQNNNSTLTIKNDVTETVTLEVINTTNDANLLLDVSGNVILPDVSQVKISGGSSGDTIITDGSGNLSWGSGGGGGSYPTTEFLVTNDIADSSKTISFVNGKKVTLNSGTYGDIKTFIKQTDSSFKYLNNRSAGINNSIVDPATNEVYVFGIFGNIDGVANTNKIAKYNPATNTFTSVGGGVNIGNEIYRGQFDSLGRLWVVGDFTGIGGTPCSNIAYWNGSTWTAGNVGTINGQVRQIIFDTANPGNYWICGAFTTANSVTVNRFAYFNGTTYVGYGAGITDNIAFNMMQNDTNNNIYISGSFNSTNAIANTACIVRFNPTTGVFSSVSGTNAIATSFFLGGFSLFVENDNVHLVGNFSTTTPTTTPTGNYAYWNGTVWTANSINGFGSSAVRDIKRINGQLYAVGEFSFINQSLYTGTSAFIPARGVAKYNTTELCWEPFSLASSTYGISNDSSSGKMYATGNNGIVEIIPDNVLNINIIDSIALQNTSNYPVQLDNNYAGVQLNQKGQSITMYWNGVNWSSDTLFSVSSTQVSLRSLTTP